MRIGENHQLVRRCGSALLHLEVLADGFAQHGMTEVFLPVQNIADGGCAPTAGVYRRFVPAIFGRILCRIRRRYQHLFLCQHFGNRRNADALTGKAEYLSDDFSRRFIHDKGLLISVGSLVAVGDGAAAPQAVLHSGLKDSLNFVAGVLCVVLVHDVQKRHEVIVLRGGAVHIVVDGNEANALLREKNLFVISIQVTTKEYTCVFALMFQNGKLRLYSLGVHPNFFRKASLKWLMLLYPTNPAMSFT